MDTLIKELNKSLNGIDESNEVINNIVIKHLITKSCVCYIFASLFCISK